jgi:hypothetical protein
MCLRKGRDVWLSLVSQSKWRDELRVETIRDHMWRSDKVRHRFTHHSLAKGLGAGRPLRRSAEVQSTGWLWLVIYTRVEGVMTFSIWRARSIC